MIKELYIINQLETGFEPAKIDEQDSLKVLLQKIKMIMFTRKGEILGDPNFGLSLEDLLFEFGFSASELRKTFDQQIASYVTEANDFELRLDINFVPGTVRDLAYIDIYVNGTKSFGVVAE
jgi:hypothetical protein